MHEFLQFWRLFIFWKSYNLVLCLTFLVIGTYTLASILNSAGYSDPLDIDVDTDNGPLDFTFILLFLILSRFK